MDTQPEPRPAATAPLWIAGGLVAVLVAVVMFVVVAATVPEVVAAAVTADQAISPMWPLLAILLFGAAGIGSIVHGRRMQHLGRLYAARVVRMRSALHDPATTGLSPGIAGTASIPQAPFGA